jgi:hypothetical protein
MYYLQGREGMFEVMRPYVIITNLATLTWFIAILYFRFKPSGRSCSGDYIVTQPANFATLYLTLEGKFIMIYIFTHYVVYFIQKIVSICITNRHETEFEKKKSLLINKV